MKKVFLALMAVAAITLTGCNNKENPSNAALEYAELCDKLIGLSPEDAKYEMANAGWEQVTPDKGAFVLKGKRSDYEKYLKNRNSKDLIALKVIIMTQTGKSDSLCNMAWVEYIHDNLSNAKSAVVAFSDYAYNKGVDQNFFSGIVDMKEYNAYKDYASFIQDVKDKDWQGVSEMMMKGNDGFSIAGEKEEDKEGVAAYVSVYVSYRIGEEN